MRRFSKEAALALAVLSAALSLGAGSALASDSPQGLDEWLSQTATTSGPPDAALADSSDCATPASAGCPSSQADAPAASSSKSSAGSDSQIADATADSIVDYITDAAFGSAAAGNNAAGASAAPTRSASGASAFLDNVNCAGTFAGPCQKAPAVKKLVGDALSGLQ